MSSAHSQRSFFLIPSGYTKNKFVSTGAGVNGSQSDGKQADVFYGMNVYIWGHWNTAYLFVHYGFSLPNNIQKNMLIQYNQYRHIQELFITST